MNTKHMLFVATMICISLSLHAQFKVMSNGSSSLKGDVYMRPYEGDSASIGTIYMRSQSLFPGANSSFQFCTQNNGSIVNALRIFNNGALGINTTTMPYGYMFNLAVGKALISYGGHAIKIDMCPADPRIWSASDEIVFYSTESATFNDIQVRNCYEYSDQRAKKEITPLSNGLSKVLKLRGVSYFWDNKQQQNTTLTNTTASTTNAISTENTSDNFGNKKNVGFIAQEVEKVIPEATITNKDGYKLLSYHAILPYVVEALQELSYQVDSLKQEVASLQNENKEKNKPAVSFQPSSMVPNSKNVAALYQNTAVAYTQDAEIKYYLPENTTNAMIYIYNLQGEELKSIPILQHDNGSVFIHGSELKPGMFVYSLVVDGKEVDSKKMILTREPDILASSLASTIQ